MHITGISYAGVVLAAIASFIFGGIWYGLLAKQWMAAAGMDKSAAESHGAGISIVPFAVALMAQIVMAWALAGILLHLARGGIPQTMRTALVSGALIWAGFVMSSLAVNHAFQGARYTLTLIDGGHWLGVLLIQSTVLILLAP